MPILKYINKKLLFITIFFPPAVILFYIYSYSVNIPYLDQWDGFLNILVALNEGSLDFSHLLAQHNEHRSLFPRIIMLLLASVSHWNVVWEQYFSLLIQFSTMLLIFDISRRSLHGGEKAIFMTIASTLLFSMVQYENWAWGWQIHIFLNTFAVTFAFWSIEKYPDSWTGFFLAITGAIIATYSFANGMLVWIIFFFRILLTNNAKKTPFVLTWLFFASGIFLSYMYHYKTPAYHPGLLEFLKNPCEFFQFFFAYIGSPFGRFFHLIGSTLFGIAGICIFLYLVINSFIYRQDDLLKRYLPWLALILYAISSAILTGIGRSGFGATPALYSRYTSFSILFWVSLFAIILIHVESFSRNKIIPSHKAMNAFVAILFSFFIICYSLSYAQGVNLFKKHFMRLSHIHNLLNYERCYGMEMDFAMILPSMPKLVEPIKTLKQLKMGAFYKEIPKPNGVYIGWIHMGKAAGLPQYILNHDESLMLVTNQNLSFKIEIPKTGYYVFSAEMGYRVGSGSISIIINDTILKESFKKEPGSIMTSPIFKWKYFGTIKLTEGLHKLSLINIHGTNYIKAISFKETSLK